MPSPDPIACRRLEVGLALADAGDSAAAVSVFEQVLEVAPGWAAARFALAEALEKSGRRDDAVSAYAAYLAADAADVMGAAIRLALLGAAPQPDRLPDAYVRTLFDQYAPRFEESLLAHLGYSGPGALRAVIDALAPAGGPEGRVLDLGCGTGLAGEAFRDRAAWLEGIDLSPGMIAQAGRKGLYDSLHVADAASYLAAAERRFDVAVAADVVVYVGNLGPLLAAVRRALAPGGLFAFTAQRAGGDGYVLGGDHRYAHSEAYLRAAAADAGLSVVYIEDAACRTEHGAPVPGFVVVLRNAAPPTVPGAVRAAAPAVPDGPDVPPAKLN